jgi:hypothetical protein
MTRPHAWWKTTNDTLASYLSLDETRRMIASSAQFAPADWQAKAKVTLGERLGRLATGVLRMGYSVGTLGLSEVMFRLASPGALTGNDPLPALDIVVGPTEAAILVVDGAISSVLTAERFSTHDFWDRLDQTLGRGPHLEVVMIDRAPFAISIPLGLVLDAQEVQAQVDATITIGLEGAERVLELLARNGGAVEGASLNISEHTEGQASFVTSTGLAERVQRRLEGRISSMHFATLDVAALTGGVDTMHGAEREIEEFIANELGSFGMTVSSCQLLLGRTEQQQLEIDRKSSDLKRQRAEMLAEEVILVEKRKAIFAAELSTLEKERDIAQATTASELEGLAESNRFGLARMVLLDDQQLEEISSEGFARRRTSERSQEVLDFKQGQLFLREKRARELEDQLASAGNQLDVGRLQMQLEKEKLEIAALAQEQNLANLRLVKEIEREDHLLRQSAQAEVEQQRLASAKDLSPEQMMAALADRDPEIARALAARCGSEAEFARKSAEDQLALMKEMQSQMANVMGKSLEANAAVASGVIHAARTPIARQQAVVQNAGKAACSGCGEQVETTWNVCPFCGAQQA